MNYEDLGVAKGCLLGCGVVVAVLVIGLAGMLVSFAAGWVAVPFHVFSASNVQDQWAFAYQYSESLDAIASQDCSALKAITAAKGDDEAANARAHEQAISANYDRVAAQYNARLRNAFQAKLVKPPDVPDIAPPLSQELAKVCIR